MHNTEGQDSTKESDTSRFVLGHNKLVCSNSHRVLVNKPTQRVRDIVAQRVEPSSGMREDPGSSLGEGNFFLFSFSPQNLTAHATPQTPARF